MRTWLLSLAVLLSVLFYTVPGYSADSAGCDLILKIQKYVSQCELVAMYGPSESGRAKGLAELRKQYASDLAKLKERASKEKGTFKELQDALSQYEAKLAPCAKCQHDYRNLLIDLPTYERCKDKFCRPEVDAKAKIFGVAWECKKGK
ncbi:MAG: hypothetical protein P8182_11275 [Deltaproteobacteria bacterium]